MFVRPASPRDYPNIPQLVEAAFGRLDESLLVQELRRDGAVVVEYVATDREELIGHIILSQMDEPKGTLALAPVSVHPDRQNRGIGSALIRAATEVAEELEWTAVIVLGNPAYYGKFGYEVEQMADFDTKYPSEFTAANVLDSEAFRLLTQKLIYPKAFLNV